MSAQKLYVTLAQLFVARANCAKSGNREWEIKHEERIKALVKEHLPSGSGFDNGTALDLDVSTGDKLVFHTNFHHMNNNGVYDGWTDHSVIVKPSLAFGFTLRVTGPNRENIKDHIYEVFHDSLSSLVE